jgi:hypothetical protein
MDTHDNSTRAGRSIDNLDRKNPVPVDPGQGSPHGRRMPHYDEEARRKGPTAKRDRSPSHK